MKKISTLLFVIFSLAINAQTKTYSEKFPIFPGCESNQGEDLENCFYEKVHDFVYQQFKMPNDLPKDYKGTMIVLFEVDEKGVFKVQYVDANEEKLTAESRRVFALMPKVEPATYNGKVTYSKYTIKMDFPLQTMAQIKEAKAAEELAIKNSTAFVRNDNELEEVSKMNYKIFSKPQYVSHLNIPFSHSFYAQFDDEMNQVGTNNHTGSKPFNYAEVSKYYNLKEANEKLAKNKSGWWGKKLWNENLVEIQGEDY